ncbi:MAG: Uma2 family endonuclease [Acidobacteriota bacterium]
MSLPVQRYRFSVDDFYRMAEANILTEDDRVELIDGEVIEMTPIGARHAACVKKLTETLGKWASGRALLSVQDPIRLSDVSELQPDIALLRRREDFYAEAHPTPSDVYLLMEIGDTSSERDRNVQLPLYAEAGIPEVWLIDLERRRIEVYSEPCPIGYGRVRRYGSEETVLSLILTDLALDADMLFK